MERSTGQSTILQVKPSHLTVSWHYHTVDLLSHFQLFFALLHHLPAYWRGFMEFSALESSFFLPLSEVTAMSLSSLNYLSLLLAHDGTHIFRKQTVGFAWVISFPSPAFLSTCCIIWQLPLFMDCMNCPPIPQSAPHMQTHTSGWEQC